MNAQTYLTKIDERLARNYDVERNKEVLEMNIDLYAKSVIHNEKYFASKKMTVWRAENYEYTFIKKKPQLDKSYIINFQNFLINIVKEMVVPHSEHMSTTITGVIATEHIPLELESMIKKFKYRKSFAFSFKGWADIRLIVVDLHSNRVLSNKKGKEVQLFYQPEIDRSKKKTIHHLIGGGFTK